MYSNSLLGEWEAEMTYDIFPKRKELFHSHMQTNINTLFHCIFLYTQKEIISSTRVFFFFFSRKSYCSPGVLSGFWKSTEKERKAEVERDKVTATH